MNALQLRRLIQWGLVAIVAIMPFHAFLSVWLGSLIGYQAAWQSWKELLTIVLAGLTIWYIAKEPSALNRWKQPVWYAIAGFGVIAALVTAIAQPGLTATLFGAKTDLEPFVLCAIAAIVADKVLAQRLARILIITTAAVIGLALLQVYLLPKEFLTTFGYNANTIAPYMLVDPALEAVRAFSTLGGALQLGSFLVLPLAFVAALALRRFRWWHPIFLIAGSLALWHTHSRAAWIGGLVALGLVVLLRLPSKWRLPFTLAGVMVAAISLQILITLSAGSSTLQYYLFHGSLKDTGFATSTDLHGQAIEKGQQILLDNPMGMGLGTAGPASYQTETPIIPESQYLQIGIELGFAGLAMFILLQILLAIRLLKTANRSPLATGLLAGLAGVATINLALHGWADSSTALVYWTIAGAYLGSES